MLQEIQGLYTLVLNEMATEVQATSGMKLDLNMAHDILFIYLDRKEFIEPK